MVSQEGNKNELNNYHLELSVDFKNNMWLNLSISMEKQLSLLSIGMLFLAIAVIFVATTTTIVATLAVSSLLPYGQ
jgi:hypothetical protein